MGELIYTEATDVVADESRCREIAAEINVIKRTTAQSVLQNAIEIGKLLIEAKEKLHHGEWGEWLRDNVAYSTANANNMMRLAREFATPEQIDFFGDNSPEIFEGMSMSQVLAILPLPANQRREFIEEHDAASLSVREIQAAVKAKEEAEAEAERQKQIASEAVKTASEALLRNQQEQEARETAEAEAEEQKEIAEKAARERDEALEKLKNAPVSEEERKKIEKEIAEKYKAKIDKAVANAQKEWGEAEKKRTEEAAQKSADALSEAVANATKASEERIASLEGELKKAKIAASPHLTEFKILMTALQEDYRKLSAVVEAAEIEEPEIGANLRSALGRIVEALK